MLMQLMLMLMLLALPFGLQKLAHNGVNDDCERRCDFGLEDVGKTLQLGVDCRNFVSNVGVLVDRVVQDLFGDGFFGLFVLLILNEFPGHFNIVNLKSRRKIGRRRWENVEERVCKV